MVKVRHLTIQGVTIMDNGNATEVIWHVHVSLSPQTPQLYEELRKFKRNDIVYQVWLYRQLPKVPSQEVQLQLVLDHYQSTLDPFGVMTDD